MKSIQHWTTLANTDLGSDVQPEAIQWEIFFEKARYTESQGYYQFNIHGLNLIIPSLRGFEFNNRDTISITTTYNLCHVTIHDTLNAIDMLESYLMDKERWFERYKLALSLKKK